MNIKGLDGAKDKCMFRALVSNIVICWNEKVGNTLTHDQKPTLEILLRSEVLGSVLNGFKLICWSGRQMSMLSLNILIV